MFKINTEKELLESFREIDRDQVQFPADLSFPLGISNYHAWVEPSGHRAFLVFEDSSNQKPLGVVFKRSGATPDYGPTMCDWCHSVRGRGKVSMMTAAVSSDRRVGVYLCADLKCGEQIAKPPGVNDLREGKDRGERIYELMSKMQEFAKKNLF